jgi:ribosomal protein S27AE
MKGVEVGRFYLPEIDKIFVTYMCDPKEIDMYDNEAEDILFICPNCSEMDTIIKQDDKTYCQKCGQEL